DSLRACADATAIMLPAHGPTGGSAGARAADLLAHHEQRFTDAPLPDRRRCVDDAVRGGVAPPGTDPRAVLAAVSAPLYYRLLASGDPIDDTAAVAAAEAAVAAVTAGVFVS
uniref:TetR-like C-terminal domain-containing protein n=1 Tax=Nocardia farcinica TaxID=37329 RepID=UPI0024569805